jgi:FkbM family methyltransferase
LRYQYDELDEDSVVFDVGGYEGDWASLIFSKYLSTVYVFEPVKSFCDHMADRFKKNGKVHIYDFGLSDRDETTDISLDANGSSTFGQNTSKESIRLRDVAAVIRELGVKDIDLMKINIEGGEYAVLERLIETGLIGRVINIQVQFHAFVPDAKVRMEHIQQELLKTHQPTFQYPWVWENWKRR